MMNYQEARQGAGGNIIEALDNERESDRLRRSRVQQAMNFREIVRLLRERKAVLIGLDGGQFDATITIETVDVHRHRFYCHVKGAQLLLCRNDLIPKYAEIPETTTRQKPVAHEQYGFDKGITKGRCNVCKIVWYWKTGTRKLKDTRCPVCNYWLYATTKYMRRFEWRPYPEKKGGGTWTTISTQR